MANPSIAPYSGAGDGTVRNMTQATWSAARGNASGTVAQPTSANNYGCYVGKNSASDWDCIRGFLVFDLSSIPAGAVVQSAVLSVYANTVYDLLGSGGWNVVAGTQASTSTLATSDFSLVGSTEFATRKTFASTSTAAYTDFTLNASGLTHLQNAVGSTVKLALRTGRDIDNTTPGSVNWEGVLIYFSEQTGTSNDPYLTVTYSTPRTTSDTWAWTDSAHTDSVLISGATTHRRETTDTWAWTDSAAPYWRAQRTPILVRAEGANTTLSGAQALNGSTITVVSTSAFPSSGTAYCHDSTDASYQTSFTYTGKTATTFTGCSGGSSHSFPSGSPVGASDAENHFPSVNELDTTSTPRILVSYTQHFAHSGGAGSIKGKISTNGGLTWGSEQTIVADAVDSGTWSTPGGHSALRCSDGTLYVSWYEQDITNRTWLRSYSVRGTPDGAGWFTFDTPVQVTSPFHADSCAVGFHAFESGGYLYQPVYGTDNSPYITYIADSYVKLLRSSDKGATWTTVGTIATEAQLGGYEGSECAILRLASGTWVALIRQETSPAGRLTCTSTDNGATWSGHTSVLASHGNDPSAHLMPEGHLIVQGQELRSTGGGVYGSTVTYVSTDSGATWPTTLWRQEENDATYSIGNGSGFATITDTSITGRRVINAYSQERASQGGAQTKFQWYALPNFPLTYDTWTWTDSAARGAVTRPRTTADSWAWSDSASGIGASYLSRTTSDTWAWTDTATKTAARSRTTSDLWAWSDTGALPSASFYSRTTTDTWAWTDSSGTMPATMYWLRARRSSSMSTPTKTYAVVQAKGTTRTATWTSPTYKAETEAGILVVLDVTSASGTGGLTLRINAHDQASSQAIPLNAAPTAVTTAGTTSYSLYPFSAVAGNVTQATSFYLPRMFSITVTHGDSSSYTYSLGYCLLP